MTDYLISFTGYRPPARQDTAWTHVRVEQMEISDDWPADETWVETDTIALPSVDSDPLHPMIRDFSVMSTLTDGWYRVLFVDDAGVESIPTTPVRFGSQVPLFAGITPTTAEVAVYLQGYLQDEEDFSDTTRPVNAVVLTAITQAVGDIMGRTYSVIPDQMRSQAKQLAALRAAGIVALSTFDANNNTDDSTYAFLNTQFTDAIGPFVLNCRLPFVTTLA